MIEKLPEYVLTEVFTHLKIFDQLAIRRVCKSWKAMVEKQLLTRRELILFHKNCPRAALFWFHDGSSVDLTNSLISNDQFKPSRFFRRSFQNIRRLYVVCYVEFIHEPDRLEFVNRFTLLEHLQVDVLPYDVVEYRYRVANFEYVLDLPNLKSFCCHSERLAMEFRIRNSPKLEMFEAPCYFRFTKKGCASFRESLKFLKVQLYSFQPGFFFPNLESFLFQCFFGNPRDHLQIALHPKLKEIHVYSNSFGLPNALQCIEQLFKQKELLDRHELDIFCLGLRWSPDAAEEIQRLPRSYLTKAEAKLFLNNSEDIKLEHAKRNLIYAPDVDNHLPAFNEQQLERLARCIEVVEFPEILQNDPTLTAKYQTLFRYVRILILSEQFQEQRDLDRLPELFPHLLEIREGSGVSLFRDGNRYDSLMNPGAFPNLFQKSEFNFDFLARFPALTRLEIDRWALSRGELERILQNCRFLRKVILSRRQLVGSLEMPIRTELSIYTISLYSTPIKMDVSRYPFYLAPLPTNQEFNESLESLVEFFSSLEELVNYLNINGYFFEES